MNFIRSFQDAPKPPKGAILPQISLIYSDINCLDTESFTSISLAFYFAGLLSKSEFAIVTLTPFNINLFNKNKNEKKEKNNNKRNKDQRLSNKNENNDINNEIKIDNERKLKLKNNLMKWPKFQLPYYIILPDSDEPYEISSKNIKNRCNIMKTNEISETSHIIFILVEPNHTQSVAEFIKTKIKKKSNTPIISFQPGVKNFNLLKTIFKDYGIMLIEGACGMDVSFFYPDINLYNGNLILGNLNPLGGLGLERFNKEKEEMGNNIANLLSQLNINIVFKKQLTPLTWGTLIYNLINKLDALTGLSYNDTLSSWYLRQIIAEMIREAKLLLKKASAGGKWEPSCLMSFDYENIDFLEKFIGLPNIFFYLLSFYYLPNSNINKFSKKNNIILPSILQNDLYYGNKTFINHTLNEFIELSERYNISIPIINKIYTLINESINKNEGIPMYKPKKLYELCNINKICYYNSLRWIFTWIFGILSIIIIIYLIFF